MEGGNKFKKKRGRDAEEDAPTSKKQVTNIDELSCSQTQQLEEVQNLKVFDFPWLHEQDKGMMCGESEDLFSSLEDSFFSSTVLNHPPTNYCTIAGVQFEFSGETETLSLAFPPPSQDKSEMWPLEASDDNTEGGRQIDGSDCIWAPLLNQPLQTTLNYT